MSGGGGGGSSRELDQTPTWAVAAVCGVIIVISFFLEKGLHHLGGWFAKKSKKAMFEALEKIKAELMILGFISLLLTISQNYIVRICIPTKAADSMLPCRLRRDAMRSEAGGSHERHLLWNDIMESTSKRRFLAADTSSYSCPYGKVPVISLNGLHQLHIFIFFLAVVHVAYSATTMALGRAKTRRWKEWENGTSSPDYEFSTDPSRFRFTHETSFVRQHANCWNRTTILLYIVSFFRQFFRSVRKTDYLTLRHGFISAHLAPGSKFNFQKYIKRSLEDDFKVVVGISPLLWACAMVILLLNVHGLQELFWVSIIPLIIILAVGTKLQAIIARMAIDIQERATVVQGIPLVKLSDSHFWFQRPQLVLFLIHFTLFQNAFQITYFFWIWYEFGLKSCFHENFSFIVARVCLGVGVQFLCSYITLPLYALVSQMGSHMKTTVFDEQTSKALRKWREAAKKRRQEGSVTPIASREPSPNASPFHQRLYRYKTICHTGRTRSRSTGRSLSDSENSDAQLDVPTKATNLVQGTTQTSGTSGQVEVLLHAEETDDEKEFSFAKLSPPQPWQHN